MLAGSNTFLCLLFSLATLTAGQVILFSDVNHSGVSIELSPGRTNLGSTSLGLTAKSITVSRRYHATLCLGKKSNPTECAAFLPGSHVLPPLLSNNTASAHVQKIRPVVKGAFGDVIRVSSGPIWSALGPNGNVLFFKIGNNRKIAYWDADGQTDKKYGLPPYDWFCTGMSLDASTGDVIMAGGNQEDVGKSARWNWDSKKWTLLGDLNVPSYYGSTNAMPDGSNIHLLGSTTANGQNQLTQPDFPEILRKGSSYWEQIPMNLSALYLPRQWSSNWFPYTFVVSDGTLLHVGPVPSMHTLDFETNQVIYRGERGGGDLHRHWGSVISVDAKGLIMVAGGTVGGSVGFEGQRTAVLIDATDPSSPSSYFTGSMKLSRCFHHLIILPTGDVLVSGGLATGRTYSGESPRYPNEIWDRVTGRWRRAAAATVRRAYHSSSLLMVDGTVMTGGGQAQTGGGDGNQDNIAFFYPPYLFNADGSYATRPQIVSGPSELVVGGQPMLMAVVDPLNKPISRITAVRMGTSNHQINLDSRFLDLTAEGLVSSGPENNFMVSAFNNANVMLPGYWVLYAFNSDGVPSKGHVTWVTGQ